MSDGSLIALLQEDPVIVFTCRDGWSLYSSGILSCSENCVVDHSLLLVGYDENSWLLKNSWGEDWGENGYIRISRRYNEDCKIGGRVYVLWSSYLAFFIGWGLIGILLI